MSELLTAVAIIFIVAGPFLLVANRLRLPTVPLLLLSGIVAGRFIEGALILELAQFGIALLVFSFGVGIQLDTVRTVLADSELAAVGQVLVVGSLGFGVGVAVGVDPAEAIYLGIAVALSSTIVGRALLQTEIQMDLVRGRLAVSIQFVQDLLAILFLLVLGAETFAADPIAAQLGYGVALLAAAVIINRHLFDVIGRLAGTSNELMIVGVVSLLVVFIGAAELAGISIVVGAFAAGLSVRHEPARFLELFNGVESIRDFFVTIFFVTVGALVTFPTLEKVLIATALVVLTAVVKPAVTAAILIYQGYEARSATLTSLSIDQISEFALIIAIEALVLGLLTQSVFDAIIFAAAATMITSSLTRRYDEEIYLALSNRGVLTGKHRKIDEWSDVPDAISDHVVVVGYGRQGQRLVERLEAVDYPYVVIENDPARRRSVDAECAAFVFGDAMEDYTWEKANADAARLIVSTVDSATVSRRILSFGFDPDIVLRSSDTTTAESLRTAGALHVSVPDVLAGQRLRQQLQILLDGELTPAELRERRRRTLESFPDVRRSDEATGTEYR